MRRQCASATIPVLFLFSIASLAQTPALPSAQSTVRFHDVSIDTYRQHLTGLLAQVDACAKARDLKSCDPTVVGPDDRIPIVSNTHTEQRLVRYGWLRVLFSKAEDPDEQPAKSSASSRDNRAQQNHSLTSQLLKSARTRLETDLAQSYAPLAAAPAHNQEHAAMQQVLAGPDFRNLQKANVRDTALEKFGNWLNHLFESAANLKARSAWVGRALVWGFVLGVCIALVYSLLRLERRWRVQLTPDIDRPAPGAASARDWQLWLEDARVAAASGMWREAIHFVYWAAISRLESRRLWPADRARTPREYLALVAPEDPRQSGLSQLTSSFERFWYGGRAANESDYKNAESVANNLISGNAAPRTNETPAVSESGAR